MYLETTPPSPSPASFRTRVTESTFVRSTEPGSLFDLVAASEAGGLDETLGRLERLLAERSGKLVPSTYGVASRLTSPSVTATAAGDACVGHGTPPGANFGGSGAKPGGACANALGLAAVAPAARPRSSCIFAMGSVVRGSRRACAFSGTGFVASLGAEFEAGLRAAVRVGGPMGDGYDCDSEDEPVGGRGTAVLTASPRRRRRVCAPPQVCPPR